MPRKSRIKRHISRQKKGDPSSKRIIWRNILSVSKREQFTLGSRRSEQLIIGRALDSIGLSPKKPSEKRVRAKVQKLGQQVFQVILDEIIGNISSKVSLAKRRQILMEMDSIIEKSKGKDGLKIFHKSYQKYAEMSKNMMLLKDRMN